MSKLSNSQMTLLCQLLEGLESTKSSERDKAVRAVIKCKKLWGFNWGDFAHPDGIVTCTDLAPFLQVVEFCLDEYTKLRKGELELLLSCRLKSELTSSEEELLHQIATRLFTKGAWPRPSSGKSQLTGNVILTSPSYWRRNVDLAGGASTSPRRSEP